MKWKKSLFAILVLAGIVTATVVTIGFLFFGIIVMPSDITKLNMTTPMGQSFYLCNNGTNQSAYCPFLSINASSTSVNATLNVTWSTGNRTICTVKFMDSDLEELADFSQNTTYVLPDFYPENSTFGLRITRVSSQAGNCIFTIVPTQ